MEKKENEKLLNLFSERLKNIMNENGVTQVELSYAMGLERSTVNKWIMKKSLPRMGVIEKLAVFFRVEKSYFLDESADVNTRIFYLDKDAQELLEQYNKLDAKDKQEIRNMIEFKLFQCAQSSEQEEKNCI
jgi:transcriptional regulator with XRE-family HTH domain